MRDASEVVYMNQAKASKAEIPALVMDRDTAIKGKGTNMDYTNVLQRAQGDAYCNVLSPNAFPGFALQTIRYDRLSVPFAQHDVSGAYVPPCKVPGDPGVIFNKWLEPCPRDTVYPSG